MRLAACHQCGNDADYLILGAEGTDTDRGWHSYDVEIPICRACDMGATTDGLPLQGSCAGEECPNDKLPGSDLCRVCESESLLGEAETRYQSSR
jgi:hypothetical protein